MLRPALAAVLIFGMLACGDDSGGGGGAQANTGMSTADGGQTTAAHRSGTSSAAASRGVRLISIGSFDSPVYVTAPREDRRRMFVVERSGTIRIVRGGRVVEQPFLDISSQVTANGEQGLLGLAFAPDYAKSGLFYVYFTGKDNRQHLVEYRRASADRAQARSARVVFVHDDPEANHNGGQLTFGPDRFLYVGTGDGGGANDQHGVRGNAQNLGSPLGKILRIDPRAVGGRPYSVPRDNPFFGRSGVRPEIYDYGLRNPWRFSFDRATGDLTIGDVGQDEVEEVDFVRRLASKGRNFGWRPFEGRRRNFDESAPGAVAPVITHAHSDGWCSITGGYVVRDRGVPSLFGRYVYGDFCKGVVYSARLRTGRALADRPVAGLPKIDSLSSFGEDAAGRIYVTSLSGPVYRIATR